MKTCIIFVLLFLLLIDGINGQGQRKIISNEKDNPVHATETEVPKTEVPKTEVPKKCEDYFNVSTCSECQKELWDSWSNPSSCGFSIRLIMNVIKDYIHDDEHTHNTISYTESVKETCDEKFSCTYDEAESLWKKVEEKCSNELTTEIDWSADPLTLNRTVSGAYATVIFYYFGIPDHDFTCSKSSSGELCGIEIAEPLIKWLKEEIPDEKFRVSYDGRFVYKEDGSRLEIPRELFSCGECQQKMAKVYKFWPVKHPLPNSITKSVFGSRDYFNRYFTCPNDNSKIRRRLPRRKNN